MDLINIPFRKIDPNDTPRPWLPVIIKNPHTNLNVPLYGLIDTGADECAIPAPYAPLLGHDLQAGIQKIINTGNGQTIAYAHTMCIEIFPGGDQNIVVENVLIDFMPNLQVVLLGVKSFLSKFILTIDYKNYTFSLKDNRS